MRSRRIAVALAALIVAVCAFLLTTSDRRRPTGSDGIAPAPSKSAPYATYDFENQGKVVNFGVQPLWLFVANIGSLLRRDGILREELERRGQRLRCHAFLKGDDMIPFVRDGHLQGGLAGDMPTMRIASSTMIVAPALTAVDMTHIVAHRAMLIDDLRGRRVAYPFGSISHHALLEALEFEGVGLDEVKQVPMDVDRIPEAFRKGDLEAFSSWEPVASRGLRLRTGAEIIQSSRFLGFTFFRKDFADQNREAVDQILAAEVRAVKWMAASKANLIQSCRWTIQDSAELVPSGFESSAEDLANIIVKLYKRNFLPIIPENDLQDGGHLHREFLFLHGLNLIDKRFVWESMRQVFDRKMILHIIAKPGTYRLAEFNYLPGVNP